MRMQSDNTIEALFEAAEAARRRAYAPYSGFGVGAAVLGANGGVYTGCNVENAAYPSGSCAEQSAISAMIAGGERAIAAVAVIADAPAPVTPCGACRQRIREFTGAETRIHCGNLRGARRVYSLADLLPDSFGPDLLPARDAR